MDGLIVHYSKGNKAREYCMTSHMENLKKKHNKCEYNNNNKKKQTHRYRGQNSGRERQYKDGGVGRTNYWV